MQLIECERLTKKYGNKKVLDKLSLKIEAGGPIGVVGPNGAGKTTFFSVVAGFIKPSSGSVKILGKAVNSSELKRKISILPQDALFPRSMAVLDTLVFFARLQGYNREGAIQQAKEVLELVNLSESARSHPETMSHGMKKRLSIAQALIGNPELVFLDEPTSGLDPATAAIIRNTITQRSKDATFLISSHNLEEIEDLCSGILILKKGRLIKQDKMANVVSRTSMLTVVLEGVPPESLIAGLQSLEGILKVAVPSQSAKSVLIEVEEAHFNKAQMDIMGMLLESGVPYREIKNGRSLEQQLVDIATNKNI